jgi:hypothetical protein
VEARPIDGQSKMRFLVVEEVMIMRAPETDPTGQPNAQLSEKAKFVGFIGSVVLLLFSTAYLMLPRLLQQRLCPPMTIWSESSGSLAVIAFGVVLIMIVAFIPVVRYGTRFAANQPPRVQQPDSAIFVFPRWQVAITAAMLCGMSALIWVNNLESYYCVSLNRILIRTGLLSPEKLTSWQEVRIVRAECGRGRSNIVWADLRLTFFDGTEITVPLRTFRLSRDYEAVRAALAARHYDYHMSETAVPNLCPPTVYPLLTNWRLE